MNYRSYKNGGNFLGIGVLLLLGFGIIPIFFALLPLFFWLFIILFIGSLLLRLFGFSVANYRFNQFTHRFSKEKKQYVELLIRISILAVKVDNRVDERELQMIEAYFRQRLRYSEADILWIRDLTRYALKEPSTLEKTCEELNDLFSMSEKILAFELVVQIILSDGVAKEEEKAFINKLVGYLNIPSFIHNQARYYYEKTNLYAETEDVEEYYAILGVSKDASFKEIKIAYRNACKEYHPDKVQHLGDEFKSVAEKKIKAINKAYNYLSKHKPPDEKS